MTSNKKRGPITTIKSLAEVTGYSVGTVSSVLNNRSVERQISVETTSKIREAALKFKYIPNIAARRLRSNQPETNQLILAIITSFETPSSVMSTPIRALQRIINQINNPATLYTIAVEMFHPGEIEKLPGLLDTNRFNGAIITNLTEKDAEFLNTAYIPFPVVIINREIPGYSFVKEKIGSGKLAANELYAINRHQLAVIRPAEMTFNTTQRFNSFRKAALEKTGIEPIEIVSEHANEESSTKAVYECLTKNKKIDGIFAVHDSLAIGAYHALDLLERKVAEDVAVIGVGDFTVSSYLRPPLSTIGVTHRSLHDEAAKSLFRLVNEDLDDPIHIDLDVEVIMRESTGHVAKETLG